MTNIAQTINVLQCLIETDGADMALTPTYHVYDMLKGHQGATSLETTVVTPSIDYEWEGTSHALPLLDASASRADNGAITLSVVNRDPVRILDAEVSVATEIQAVSAVELTGPATNSENRPGQTPTVTPRDVPVACDNGILRHPFPPRSVTVMTIVP